MYKKGVYLKIFVKTLAGETKSLTVEPSDTIAHVKSKVGDKVDDEGKVLIFNETVLEDSSHVSDFDIKNGSTLTLLPKSTGRMQIFVYGRKKFPLEVKHSDTILYVKAKIYDIEGIPTSEQILLWEGRRLDDSRTLDDYDIDKGDTLNLFKNLTVKTCTGKMITLQVKGSDTIFDVKSMIENNIHIPVEEQALIFDGEILEEDIITLANFGIIRGSTLTLLHRSRGLVPIFVKFNDGYIHTLKVKLSDTIYNVKTNIPHTEPSKIVLIFNDKVLDDNSTLCDFDIKKGSTLTVMHKKKVYLKIFVKTPTGETKSMVVEPSDTIANVKSFVGDEVDDEGKTPSYTWKAKIHDIQGIPTSEQVLLLNGKRLMDSRTLDDYDIHKGDTLDLFKRDFLGIPPLPPYANPAATRSSILQGVNYASASAGILEETGRNLGERISFRQQVENFASNLYKLKYEMGEEQLSEYLKKSLAVVIMGSNDYINNYLLTSLYATSYIYTPTTYTDILIQRYMEQILALYSLGLRKFFLAGIGPLGCIPNQLANNFAPPGKCALLANDMAVMFNTQLRSLVTQLNRNYTDAIFVYGNTYGAVSDILSDANSYGFTVTDRGCCGIGRNQGQITCLPFSTPCINRDQHVFWDAFHPTQAANKILAEKAYSGQPSDCYPMNIKQMAEI
ncbi:GDSL-like lipase/acylhydrolase superfamily protein [Tanacetum coccineum]